MGVRFLSLVYMLLAPLLLNGQEVQILKGGPLYTALILPAGINSGLLDTEERIVIRGFQPRRLAELSMLSEDGQQGRHVENIQWSKDNKFLLFTTSSSGGHSPWNFRTYVFSTEHWQFLCLDEAVAPVTNKDFEFTDPSHVSMETLNSSDADVDNVERRVVDLQTLPWKK